MCVLAPSTLSEAGGDTQNLGLHAVARPGLSDALPQNNLRVLWLEAPVCSTSSSPIDELDGLSSSRVPRTSSRAGFVAFWGTAIDRAVPQTRAGTEAGRASGLADTRAGSIGMRQWFLAQSESWAPGHSIRGLPGESVDITSESNTLNISIGPLEVSPVLTSRCGRSGAACSGPAARRSGLTCSASTCPRRLGLD